jgi:hypothetical protein
MIFPFYSAHHGVSPNEITSLNKGQDTYRIGNKVYIHHLCSKQAQGTSLLFRYSNTAVAKAGPDVVLGLPLTYITQQPILKNDCSAVHRLANCYLLQSLQFEYKTIGIVPTRLVKVQTQKFGNILHLVSLATSFQPVSHDPCP